MGTALGGDSPFGLFDWPDNVFVPIGADGPETMKNNQGSFMVVGCCLRDALEIKRTSGLECVRVSFDEARKMAAESGCLGLVNMTEGLGVNVHYVA